MIVSMPDSIVRRLQTNQPFLHWVVGTADGDTRPLLVRGGEESLCGAARSRW